ncbi:cutinase family protein [Corynebacterium sp. HS2168-gen11]|uniref:cutinase family protein n=1 Tax=Corynebacterium sp. HS2168-gen11 TaxID=2974027 RepID=UPI00216B1717|nr:cutinase family protein [Corynebacterium sp. HS2168-gen11]MCS4535974.1 cutinase family protein [Corynebacterium sp. HS2168-gen11]
MKKALTAIAALVVVLVIGQGVLQWVQQGNMSGEGLLPAPEPEIVQPAHCPNVELIAAPGTWESSIDDDPFAPHTRDNALLLQVTQPIRERFNEHDLKVWTLPYSAQFKNVNALEQLSYDDSRNEGAQRLEQELREVHAECPLTDFILVGFSQGAVIVGDLANEIGTGKLDIPEERIRGVALIADGRREPGVGQAIGTPIGGVGAEIALAPLSFVIQAVVPGASMRGPREGGFGTLHDRVMDICAPNDSICDAPNNVSNALGRAEALITANGVHAQYATNPDVIPGTTATAWVLQWATDLTAAG